MSTYKKEVEAHLRLDPAKWPWILDLIELGAKLGRDEAMLICGRRASDLEKSGAPEAAVSEAAECAHEVSLIDPAGVLVETDAARMQPAAATAPQGAKEGTKS